MPFKRAAIGAAFLALCAGAVVRPLVSETQLIGIWNCGPTVMKGAEVTVTASYVLERKKDMTFTDTGSTLVEPKGKPAFTFQSSSRGTWKLDGDIIVSTSAGATFLSSSNPLVTQEIGQKVVDEEERKAPVSKSRVVHIDAKSMSKISVDGLYPEAAVRSYCKRK